MEIIIYKSENSDVQVEVSLDKDTVWLSQKQMATLFNKNMDTMGPHLKNIYKEKELGKNLTTELFSVVKQVIKISALRG